MGARRAELIVPENLIFVEMRYKSTIRRASLNRYGRRKRTGGKESSWNEFEEERETLAFAWIHFHEWCLCLVIRWLLSKQCKGKKRDDSPRGIRGLAG